MECPLLALTSLQARGILFYLTVVTLSLLRFHFLHYHCALTYNNKVQNRFIPVIKDFLSFRVKQKVSKPLSL